jgi:hypothetical protein
MSRVYGTNGENRRVYMILVGTPEEKRPLERSRRRWVDHIKTDITETEWDGMEWIDLTPLIHHSYYFACGSVWVRNFVSNIKGGTKTEGA